MQCIYLLRKPICGACLALWLGISCAAQDSGNPIADEIARLKQALSGLAENDAAAFRPMLEQAEQDLKAGRTFATLFRLQRGTPQLLALQYGATHKALAQGGLAAFDAEWQRAGAALTAGEKRLAARPNLHASLAARALSEAALTKIKPLYLAGRLFSREDSIASGLYYLGQALGSLAFARFSAALPDSKTRPAFTPRSLAPALAELEQDILAAYSQANVAAEQDLYNQLNATLKTAQELNQERRYAGALLQYLEARRVLGVLKALETPPTLVELQTKSAAFQTQMAARQRDDSLAQMYWEVAQSALSTASPDNLKQAAVLLHEVLPRYFQLIPE
ncbi:MAG: hypothetical protein HYR56_28700 [Acidobacteria bacterium]|nr:hypothetical protein [Acidobacteriota bacterium]MBI3424034.1 hypothetical protein [Acidobacteriota bacterium]